MIPVLQGTGEYDIMATRALSRTTTIGAACACALLLAAPSTSSTVAEGPAAMSAVQSAMESVPAACRRILIHRLRHQLDDGDLPYLTDSALRRTAEPLRAGGADLCDEIVGQSFVLGGS